MIATTLPYNFISLKTVNKNYSFFLQLVIFHEARGPFIEEFTQCVTHGFYTEKWQEQLYTTLSLVFMFVLPLVILITTYLSTVITISRKSTLIFWICFSCLIEHWFRDYWFDALIFRLLAKPFSLTFSVKPFSLLRLLWRPFHVLSTTHPPTPNHFTLILPLFLAQPFQNYCERIKIRQFYRRFKQVLKNNILFQKRGFFMFKPCKWYFWIFSLPYS